MREIKDNRYVEEEEWSETCQTCVYYFDGECRRFPPTQPPKDGYEANTFPIVDGEDWCGEYKQR